MSSHARKECEFKGFKRSLGLEYGSLALTWFSVSMCTVTLILKETSVVGFKTRLSSVLTFNSSRCSFSFKLISFNFHNRQKDSKITIIDANARDSLMSFYTINIVAAKYSVFNILD